MVHFISDQMELVNTRLVGLETKVQAVGYLRQTSPFSKTDAAAGMFTVFDPTLLVGKNVTVDMEHQAFRIQIAGLYRVKMSTMIALDQYSKDVGVSLRRDTTTLNSVFMRARHIDYMETIHDTVITGLPVGSVITMWVQSDPGVTMVMANTSMSIELLSGI
jgi:hypothetical protein